MLYNTLQYFTALLIGISIPAPKKDVDRTACFQNCIDHEKPENQSKCLYKTCGLGFEIIYCDSIQKYKPKVKK